MNIFTSMFGLCECVLTQHAGALEKEMEQTECAGEGEDCWYQNDASALPDYFTTD